MATIITFDSSVPESLVANVQAGPYIFSVETGSAGLSSRITPNGIRNGKPQTPSSGPFDVPENLGGVAHIGPLAKYMVHLHSGTVVATTSGGAFRCHLEHYASRGNSAGTV